MKFVMGMILKNDLCTRGRIKKGGDIFVVLLRIEEAIVTRVPYGVNKF